MTHLTRFVRFLALMALAGGWLCASMAAQAAGINCGDKPIRLAFYEYGNLYYQDKQQALVTGLRTDGTLKRIYNRYLPADEAAALLDF